MRKRNILSIFIILFLSIQSFGQRFAYVDTDYILDLIPEYKSAQKQLDAIAAGWEKEGDKMSEDIDKMIKDYEAEKILLTEEMKKKREAEIHSKEIELKDFRNRKFGYEGELFKKRQELVKPIQDKVFDAVQKVAKQSALDFIFAKGGDLIMLYSNSKYDKSDEVLKEMGITVNRNKSNQSGASPGTNGNLNNNPGMNNPGMNPMQTPGTAPGGGVDPNQLPIKK